MDKGCNFYVIKIFQVPNGMSKAILLVSFIRYFVPSLLKWFPGKNSEIEGGYFRLRLVVFQEYNGN
jgi:hypothetical protein